MSASTSAQAVAPSWPVLAAARRGDWRAVVGESALIGTWTWAAVAGLPRLGALLDPTGGWPVHAFLALLGLVALPLVWAWAARGGRPLRGAGAALLAHGTGSMGLFGALTLAALCLFTPLISPYAPDAQLVGPALDAPSWAHPFGTDRFGRDMLSRVLYGSRISLTIGFVAVGVSATLGTLVGAVAGYAGGWVDAALMWCVDLLLALPRLVLLIAIVGVLRTTGAQSIFLIVLILGLTGWQGVARIVRAQVLSLREREFVQAARALGFGPARVLGVHVVPNVLAPVIVFASLAMGATILAEAGLSYLGLGVSPPTSTWGTLVRDGAENARVAPWLTWIPGLFIVWAVMCFNLIGDGLRDVLDPRLQGR